MVMKVILLLTMFFVLQSNSVCQFQLTFTSSDDLEPAFSCQIQLSVDLDIEPEGLRLVVQSGSSCQPFTLPLNRVFDMRIVAQNSAGSTTLAEQIRLSEYNHIITRQ